MKYIELLEKNSATIERANAMGFDTSRVWYHGTTGVEIKAFDPKLLGRNTNAQSAKKGFFFTDNPIVAQSYGKHEYFMADYSKPYYEQYTNRIAELEQEIKKLNDEAWAPRKEESSKLYHDFYTAKKNKKISAEEYFKRSDEIEKKYNTHEFYELNKKIDELMKEKKELERRTKDMHKSGSISKAVIHPVYLKMKNPLICDMHGNVYREITYSEIITKAKRGRRDGVIIKNTFDPGYRGAENPMCNIAVVFLPQQIRSIFANFDPEKADSPNISD